MRRNRVNLLLQVCRMTAWIILSIGSTAALTAAWVLSMVSKNQDNRRPYFKTRSIVDVKE
jgi:hypothetical protein